MNEHSGLTTSIWMSTSIIPELPSLTQNLSADVCIVGAGIAGLTTGYLLAREGKSVVILDDGPIAGGETERTTAHLSNELDDGYSYLEQVHGPEGARMAAESHTAAIAMIESIVAEERIDCDFTRLDGYLFAPPGMSPEDLREEFEAARRAGLAFVEALPRAPLNFFDTGPCLRFPRQGQFHPLRYLAGLVSAIQRHGGQLFANTHASKIRGGSPATVETSAGFRVDCKAIVVATNSPVNDRVTIHTKQAPYRTYVIALRVPAGAVPRALYWDTVQDAESASEQAAPYHYVRLQTLKAESKEAPAQELLIVGGEDHKTGQADDAEARWDRLERWARQRFPMAGAVEYRWSGQVMEPIDGLAYIGRNPGDEPNVYIATGDSGEGMTHGTIAGMLLLDLISGRHNEWAALYDPARVRVGAATDFAGENLNVATQYAEYFTGGEMDSVDQLAPDSGAVVRRGLLKAAVYRDEQGALHEFSAICPHLGCIVHWNHAEKTWDCPCHGSRYTKFGEVVNGPSITNLHALSREKAAH